MEEKELNSQNGITLGEIFLIMKKNIAFILIVTGLFTLVGIVYGFGFKSTTYTASSTAIVMADSSSTGNNSYQDYLFSNYLVNSFKTFIVSEPVFANASEKTGISKKTLKDSVSVSTTQNSLIIQITAKSSVNNETAIKIANAILDSAMEIAKTKVDDEYKYEVLANKLVDMEYASEATAKKGVTTVVVIAFAIGLVISLIVVFIRNMLDDTVKSKEFLEKECKLSILTTISDIGGGK